MSAACHQSDIRVLFVPFATWIVRVPAVSGVKNWWLNRRSLPTDYWLAFQLSTVQVDAMTVHSNLGRSCETYITRYLSQQIYRADENGRVVIPRWLPRERARSRDAGGCSYARKMPVKVCPDDRSYDDSRPTCRAAPRRQSLPDEANEPFDASCDSGAQVRAVVTIYLFSRKMFRAVGIVLIMIWWA